VESEEGDRAGEPARVTVAGSENPWGGRGDEQSRVDESRVDERVEEAKQERMVGREGGQARSRRVRTEGLFCWLRTSSNEVERGKGKRRGEGQRRETVAGKWRRECLAGSSNA